MDQYVLNLIQNYGYLGMFLGMVLEAVIIVIPSELILATGGILASQEIFSFWGAFLVGLFGSVFCAVIIYAMGYYGGKGFAKKYGKYFRGEYLCIRIIIICAHIIEICIAIIKMIIVFLQAVL